jgi:hypothetical protein
MNTKDLLNHYLYPVPGDNIRRSDDPYYDTLTITAGQTEYFFFTTPVGNPFLRNKTFPLAGSEIFFMTGFSAYISLNVDTLALINSMNEVLQQSFLEISIDDRVIGKYPGLDFVNYLYQDTLADQVVVSAGFPKVGGNLNSNRFYGRLIDNSPIIINSTSAFRFRFVTTAAAATAFAEIPMRLVLHGLQLDKLDSFYWNNLKTFDMFQQIPVTYYNTVVIASGAANTFQLFANPNAAQNLFSKTFPLSDITTFSLQNIEIFVNQPDTPIEPTTIWNSRITNVFNINIDDVLRYNSDLQNLLSVFAATQVALTTTPDLDVLTALHVRQSKTLKVPLDFPANSLVGITLQQPVASLGVTGEITVALRGVENRRLA